MGPGPRRAGLAGRARHGRALRRARDPHRHGAGQRVPTPRPRHDHAGNRAARARPRDPVPAGAALRRHQSGPRGLRHRRQLRLRLSRHLGVRAPGRRPAGPAARRRMDPRLPRPSRLAPPQAVLSALAALSVRRGHRRAAGCPGRVSVRRARGGAARGGPGLARSGVRRGGPAERRGRSFFPPRQQRPHGLDGGARRRRRGRA